MLFWAANFHVVKITLEFYSPVSVAALRFFFGVVSLFLLVYLRFGNQLFKFRFSAKEWWYMFLTSFFGIFLTIYFFNLGLKTTSAVNGSLIIATSPAITAVFTFLFQRKKVKLVQWIAIAISFFGVAIILVKGDFSKLAELQFEIGDMYIMSMAIVFSLSQVIVSKYLPHVDVVVMTTITSLMAFVLFAVFSLPEFITTDVPTDLSFWSSILFMGVLGTGIAYTAFYFCVVKLGATTSTLFMNLIPFFAVLLAFPFGETLYAVQLAGGGIIIIGLLLFGFTKKKK
ncbi:EamA-like transporter family protein [Aquimarina sp. MAR_2010_214]|nr:EamA-like transporter family protein [Aquimarina sp. MAR_2010_214]